MHSSLTPMNWSAESKLPFYLGVSATNVGKERKRACVLARLINILLALLHCLVFMET